MPRPQKKPKTEYFDRKFQKEREKMEKDLQVIQDKVKSARAKKAELLKRRSCVFKHVRVKNAFLKMTKVSDLERVVSAIDDGTKLGETLGIEGEQKGMGEEWEQNFVTNLEELCRVADDALTNIQKYIKLKEKEADKITVEMGKTQDFYNSCLEKLKEMKSEEEKPFQINSIESSGNDYLYENTPFQCYSLNKSTK